MADVSRRSDGHDPSRAPWRGRLIRAGLVLAVVAGVIVVFSLTLAPNIDDSFTPAPSATPTGQPSPSGQPSVTPTGAESSPPPTQPSGTPTDQPSEPTPEPTSSGSELDAFVRACEENDGSMSLWRPGQVDYPAVLPAKLKQATTYNAAVDVRSEPLPAPTVIENPGGDSTSEPVHVQCVLGARLVAVGDEVVVEPVGEWQYRTFTPTGVVEWSWTVTSNTATDHQVRLELRPAVRLDGSVGDGSSQLASFTTRVAIQATLIERVSYWVDTQGALLKGIAAAVGAAVVAVLLWWDKLPLRRKRSPASSATTSSGPDGDAGPWVPPAR